MTAKEFLKPLKTMQTDIETKRDQLRSIRESLESITPTYNEKIGCSGLRNVHRMSEKICEVIDIEQDLSNSIEQLIALKCHIIAAINEIPDSECQAILHWRYMKHLPWSAVADKVHMTEDGIYKKHRKALSELEKTTEYQNWAVQNS
ncbi:MAG: DUF1492 domain-containing protein [Oscillospiraceae bacterium]|nr:DUF1492 domain-containing protein [Oscillospiraceae bacterium]